MLRFENTTSETCLAWKNFWWKYSRLNLQNRCSVIFVLIFVYQGKCFVLVFWANNFAFFMPRIYPGPLSWPVVSRQKKLIDKIDCVVFKDLCHFEQLTASEKLLGECRCLQTVREEDLDLKLRPILCPAACFGRDPKWICTNCTITKDLCHEPTQKCEKGSLVQRTVKNNLGI